jgi:hypothetical protein
VLAKNPVRDRDHVNVASVPYYFKFSSVMRVQARPEVVPRPLKKNPHLPNPGTGRPPQRGVWWPCSGPTARSSDHPWVRLYVSTQVTCRALGFFRLEVCVLLCVRRSA